MTDDRDMLDLFRQEAEAQIRVLTAGLLALERNSGADDQLEACMRAAHSLKGAARIVGLPVAVRLTHAMEDAFVAAQQGRLSLGRAEIDRLLDSVDLLDRITAGAQDEPEPPSADGAADVNARLAALEAIVQAAGPPVSAAPAAQSRDLPVIDAGRSPGAPESEGADRVLRVTAESLNRLLGLSGEALVESRWVAPFAGSLLRLKRLHDNASRLLDDLRDTLAARQMDEQIEMEVTAVRHALAECRQALSQRLADLEQFDRRSGTVAHRMYDEALACRMRPLGDALRGFPRSTRDLAHALGKELTLDIAGADTQVDRDVLARIEAPLGHLLRNAVDHGIETPDERRAAGKPAQATVRIEARHSAGTLLISVSDDGRGVDLDRLRRIVIEQKLTNEEAASALTEAELIEFLFLPGFTMKGTVTDISGRGVGLDAVKDMVSRLRGTLRMSTRPGLGSRVQLQLPVTLSVVRTLLAEIGGEPYAFPLVHIVRALKVRRGQISRLEGRAHFEMEGRRVGLVAAHQVFETGATAPASSDLPVIVLGDASHAYGLIVDRFLGERELIVQPLDPQLGKIKNISAGALMDDGTPVLIVDADDLVQSLDKLVVGAAPAPLSEAAGAMPEKRRKRVLVVDDSLTVRELQRKLLGNRGYEVVVAVDGVDGWNAARTGRFDLVVTDVDMPRMDGIELVRLITRDPNLKSIPVMIVSYKDRDEDRARGLEAGAAYYLTKSSFHDDTLVQAVVDLIGEASA